ncbi:MAG: DUF5719 family protein [Actinomycetota bacterium]
MEMRSGDRVPGSGAARIAATLALLLVLTLTGAILPSGLAAAQTAGPDAPQGLEVFSRQEDRGIRVTLSWNLEPGCSAYKVYRSDRADGEYTYIGGVSAETMGDFPFFLDNSVTPGAFYCYKVSALDAEWREGPLSIPVRARVAPVRRAAAVRKSMMVSLADQRLYCFEDGVVVNILRVSTGAGGATPTGRYSISQHAGTVWVTGLRCDYWMVWKPNYGMHSWPWWPDGYRDYETSVGVTPRSHGCIRVHPLEASWPYYWAPDGTPLTIVSHSLGKLPLQGAGCSSGATAPSKTWYFAEGYIEAEFIEYLLLFNPGTTPVNALTTYFPEGHPRVVESYYLPPGSRQTVNVNNVGNLPQSYGHAIKIEADGPIVAQQSEFYNCANRRGGDLATGVTAPSRTWYFAEGFTGAHFSTYLLLFNPGAKQNHVKVNYLVNGGTPYLHEFDMAAESRGTTLVDALPGLDDKEVSMSVDSQYPLVAERAEYFAWPGHVNGVNGGDLSMGLTAPAKQWFLAEGCTGHFFDEYILVNNPGPDVASLDVQFLTAGGPVNHVFAAPPLSRITICVDSIPGLEDADTGAIINSDREVVVERAMYLTRDSRRGGHVNAGITDPSEDWYFAEGFTGGTFDEYILVMNPNDNAAFVNLLFHLENGSDVGAGYAVPARGRITIHVDEIPGVEWTGSAVELHSDIPVVAEQAEYFCMPR